MSTQVTIKEAADTLGISEQRVRTLCRTGVLSAIKFGRSWMLETKSIKHYGLQTSHVIAEDHATYTAQKDTASKPIALSFFSGAMGLDIGIEKAGFDVRLACEVDKYSRQTIALNKPDIALLGDVNDYSKQDILDASGLSATDEIDLIFGVRRKKFIQRPGISAAGYTRRRMCSTTCQNHCKQRQKAVYMTSGKRTPKRPLRRLLTGL